jgi:sarcosine oxidase, subunit gamma
MIATAMRRSPIHDELEHLSPTWVEINGMAAAAHFGDPATEARQAKILGLCDVSARPRMGVKGAGAAAWLEQNGIHVPTSLYGHGNFGNDGIIIRPGNAEFFIEDEAGGEKVNQLLDSQSSVPASVYRYDRQDAAMLLSGSKAFDVLAETCGYDFRHAEQNLVFSRVAVVSCMILQKDREPQTPLFHIWCDGSYGAYLWEQLLEIIHTVGGSAIGLQAFEQA